MARAKCGEDSFIGRGVVLEVVEDNENEVHKNGDGGDIDETSSLVMMGTGGGIKEEEGVQEGKGDVTRG